MISKTATKTGRNRSAQLQRPVIVEQGAGWWIERDPVTRDYSAMVAERGYVGSGRTSSEAYSKVAAYLVPDAS